MSQGEPRLAGHGFRLDASSTQAFKAIGSLHLPNPLKGNVDPTELRAVVIGGGTGAPMSIRTLLALGVNTSAVVAMADDGGSTGILREEAHVTPPGDVRKCLAAFAANPEDPLTKAFKYRFDFARNHTLGNLMLSALENATGSFPEAIKICGQLLGARGHVYPSTLNNVTLCAETRDGRILRGQSVAGKSSTALERVWLESPELCLPYMEALRAIRQADVVVLGPGSLFTSIIPNLLVPGIVDAIRQSNARTVFVCSLADQQGETWGLSAREHVEALLRHGMEGCLWLGLDRAKVQWQSAGMALRSNPAFDQLECRRTTSMLSRLVARLFFYAIWRILSVLHGMIRRRLLMHLWGCSSYVVHHGGKRGAFSCGANVFAL